MIIFSTLLWPRRQGATETVWEFTSNSSVVVFPVCDTFFCSLLSIESILFCFFPPVSHTARYTHKELKCWQRLQDTSFLRVSVSSPENWACWGTYTQKTLPALSFRDPEIRYAGLHFSMRRSSSRQGEAPRSWAKSRSEMLTLWSCQLARGLHVQHVTAWLARDTVYSSSMSRTRGWLWDWEEGRLLSDKRIEVL